MKNILIPILLCIIAATGNTVSAQTISGDFNGDGRKEECTLQKPVTIEDEMECKGECECILHFSDKKIKPLKIKQCIGGSLRNLGDLNGDGHDEIGFLPGWWTSCWMTYHVYTYRNGKWIELLRESVHCNLLEELEASGGSVVEKIPDKKGYVKVHFSVFEEEGIISKERTEKLK